MNRLSSCLAYCGLLLLTACAGMPQPPTAQWEQHRAAVQRLEYWTILGKIALRNAEQAESANLLWQQAGDASHLRLHGPLGISATTIDSDGKVLEIRQGDDYSKWQLDDPALASQGGWDLPLLALHQWMKGIPDARLPVDSMTLDPAAQLASQIRQQGWTVEYQAFGQFGDYRLPTRLRLYKGQTSARIILRQWKDLATQ